MHKPTIFVFSRSPETLAEISARLTRLGCHTIWVPIKEWTHSINELWRAAGVIVDMVDPEFSHQAELEDLLAWLQQLGCLPVQALFLVDTYNHRLDYLERVNPLVRIHHYADDLTDDDLMVLVQKNDVALDLVA